MYLPKKKYKHYNKIIIEISISKIIIVLYSRYCVSRVSEHHIKYHFPNVSCFVSSASLGIASVNSPCMGTIERLGGFPASLEHLGENPKCL